MVEALTCERAQIVTSPSPVQPRAQCVHEVFESQAARSPRATALLFEGRRVTYRELSAHSTRFARRLQALGVQRGTFVAIYAPRSLESIVCLLGILKAGAAYVALDMESPAGRLEPMLADVEPTVILTLPPLAADLPPTSAEILFLNEEIDLRDTTPLRESANDPANPCAADDIAYVSFTSGSTGTPKGVCIPHRGVLRLAQAGGVLSFRREDLFLQFAPLSFDASTFEIWNCLLNGASLAIFPPWKPSLTDLGEFIETQRVSVLWLSAGLFHQMTEHHLPHFSHVRRLFTGGDVVSVPHAERVLQALPNCRLVNGYGPTENTTFSCCHAILSLPADGRSIPIGRPIAGTECLVLDERMQPVPPGVKGELYLGGDGLATGYLRNESLTREKFIPHPFNNQPGTRLYRTGDQVLQLPDGSLEFHGRLDRQVKILGYRVEPSEIEAILRQHPSVSEAAVIGRGSLAGEEQLEAAIVLKPGASLTAAALRDFARSQIPHHMIPSDFTFLDALPLLPNGKVDHAALCVRCAPHSSATLPASESASPAALAVAALWTHVLGRPSIGPGVNFFEMGGNSLRAAHLLARVQKEFGKRVPMNVFARNPTINGLADFLSREHPLPQPALHVSRGGGTKPALFCMPGQGGALDAWMGTADHYSGDRPIHGLQAPALLGLEDGRTIEEMAALQVKTIRSIQPSGPYHVFGFCFGGLLAFETARQLYAQNAEVGMVGVLQFDIHDMPFAPFKPLRIRSLYHFMINLPPAFAEAIQVGAAERNNAIIRTLYRMLNLPPDEEGTYPSITDERRLYEVHQRAWRKYVPEAIPGPVTLFRPRRLPILQPDPRLGWHLIKTQRLEVRIVPGEGIHGACLGGRNGRTTAHVVEQAIEARELELNAR